MLAMLRNDDLLAEDSLAAAWENRPMQGSQVLRHIALTSLCWPPKNDAAGSRNDRWLPYEWQPSIQNEAVF